MAGTTYSKFFWQDWQGDLELKMCSLGAQGWWMRLLCVAGAANDRGRVTIAGRKPLPDDMRRATGCINVTDEEISAWESELVHNKVCDQDPDGVLVSRRQRRAADRSHPQIAGGKARARTAARNGGRFAPADDQQAHQQKTPAGASSAGGGNINRNSGITPAHQHQKPATISHQPESINHQPHTPTPETFEQKLGKIAKLGQALGFDPTTARNGHRFIEDLVRLEADGFDFELDILATIQERRATGSVPRDLGSLSYFRKAFEAKRETRKLTGAIAEARASAPVEQTDTTGWDKRLLRWLESGWWPPQYGPRPLAGNCLAPPDRIAAAKVRWEEQGGHPRGAFPADPNGRFLDWKDLRDLREDPNVDYGNRALNVVAIPRRTA